VSHPAIGGLPFEVWEPVYERILADFGYDRGADERARDRLQSLCTDTTATALEPLDFGGQRVAVAGGAERLRDELDVVRSADTVVAASVAADRLRAAGIDVDCLVTDLDGTPDTARILTDEGTPVAVHAHGDNIPAIEDQVPTFDHQWMLPTTQAEPVGVVANPGGFTDGDRAAFLADALGAQTLVFPGWAFDDPTVTVEKRRKLRWAERLLLWLEQHRNGQFAVLDGRRSGIDSSSLPI